jgi:hypothetical protein
VYFEIAMETKNFCQIGTNSGGHAPAFYIYYHDDMAENADVMTEKPNEFFAPVIPQLKEGDLIFVIFTNIYLCFSFNGHKVFQLDAA